MVERVAPDVLGLLADGVPRTKAAIVAALAGRHAGQDVTLALIRLAVTGRVGESGGKYRPFAARPVTWRHAGQLEGDACPRPPAGARNGPVPPGRTLRPRPGRGRQAVHQHYGYGDGSADTVSGRDDRRGRPGGVHGCQGRRPARARGRGRVRHRARDRGRAAAGRVRGGRSRRDGRGGRAARPRGAARRGRARRRPARRDGVRGRRRARGPGRAVRVPDREPGGDAARAVPGPPVPGQALRGRAAAGGAGGGGPGGAGAAAGARDLGARGPAGGPGGPALGRGRGGIRAEETGNITATS